MRGFFDFGSPIIELPIDGRKLKMLLDTGFNGHIMLPQSVIEELGLDQIGVSDYLTASGDKKLTEVYIGKILFFDEEIEVPILSTNPDIYLAGMELFKECKIVIEQNKNIVEIIKSK